MCWKNVIIQLKEERTSIQSSGKSIDLLRNYYELITIKLNR